MLNKLAETIRQEKMLSPGDRVICAVSGGADSMALLLAMYLLKDKFSIDLAAAHFNHGLRGEESDRDEAFVASFCDRFDIPLYRGSGQVTAGPKGLEAAAREARYAFLRSLPGIVATAHTADDNAETVLMHLVRGTGLRGLGGITPVSDGLIRPMLTVTRKQVLAFLEEYHISCCHDSTNDSDAFLRNRLRHHVMPLLLAENPSLPENLSQMALRLRQDEEVLAQLTVTPEREVTQLQKMHPALRARHLAAILEASGLKEPSAAHIRLAEKLVFSENPSARADFPGGVVLARRYGVLEKASENQPLEERFLQCPGSVTLDDLGLKITCKEAAEPVLTTDCFTVLAKGQIRVRCRKSGDAICLKGGKKTLKKLFIDKKIPAGARQQIPVICDDGGVLGVYGIGGDLDRHKEGVSVLISFEKI